MKSAAHDYCLRKIVTYRFDQAGFKVCVHVDRPEVWELIGNPLKNCGVQTTQFRCHQDVETGHNHTLVTDKNIEDLQERLGCCVERGVGEGEGAIVVQDAQHGHRCKDESHLGDSTLNIGNTSVVVFFSGLNSFFISF